MEKYSTLSRDRSFRKRTYLIAGFVLISLIALYGFLFSIESYFGGTTPEGFSGSSFATIEEGTRAWSDLLILNDYKVVRDKGRATFPKLENIEAYTEADSKLKLNRSTQTVVILDGALPKDEVASLITFVKSGGRLITNNPLVLEDVLTSNFTIDLSGSTDLEVPSFSEVDGLDPVGQVKGSGVGSIRYRDNDQTAPLLLDSSQDRQLGIEENGAAIFKLANGDVIALADQGIVTNELLDEKDNALFSLKIAGANGSGVTFIEGIHGYEDPNGFAGMPLSWRIAIVGLFVAFVIFGCSQGRRFGVGEEPDRNLGPRRIYFAHAIARTLRKTKS